MKQPDLREALGLDRTPIFIKIGVDGYPIKVGEVKLNNKGSTKPLAALLRKLADKIDKGE